MHRQAGGRPGCVATGLTQQWGGSA